MFAKAVAEATDNKFQIQVFAAGEIVPGLQAADAVTNGTVEMCHTASYYYVGKDPTYAFGHGACRSGSTARMQTAWLHFGGGMDLLNEFYKKSNFFALPCRQHRHARWAAGSARRSRTVDDLNGLKMRIGGFAGRVFTKLGRCRSSSPAATSIRRWRRARIDAGEWVGPYDDEKLGFTRSRSIYYYPGWWEGGAMLHNFINLDKWNALPKTYQAIVKTASRRRRVDAGEVRRGATRGAEAAGRRRRAAASVPAAGDGSVPRRRRSETLQRSLRQECRFQEGAAKHGRLPQRPVSVVAGRRIQLTTPS